MEELKNSRISIKVEGANVHNGEPLFVDITDDKIILKTKIGKTKIQTLLIEIERNVIVKELKEEEKPSTNTET